MSRSEKYESVSSQQPCASCGKPDWCSRSTDGFVEICRRDQAEGWLPREDKNGNEYWVRIHRNRPATDVEPMPEPPRAALATPEILHKAHEVFLAAMAALLLTPDDREKLLKRGFSLAQIEANGYFSHRADEGDRMQFALAVERAVGAENLPCVPGFYRRQGDETPRLSGPGGLGVPVRDVNGFVIAHRIRVEETVDEKQTKRYLYLAAPKGPEVVGNGPGSPCHVPRHDKAMRNGVVRITEGELKADLATVYSGVLTISIPGVQSWRRALPVLKSLGARRVLLALDGDARTNPFVANALQQVAGACVAEGYAVGVEVWPETWKGIDDALTRKDGGKHVVTIHEGAEAWRMIAEIVASGGAEIAPVVSAHVVLAGLPEQLQRDADSAAFAPEVLEAAAVLLKSARSEFEALVKLLKKAKVRISEWQKAVKKAGKETVCTPSDDRADLPEIILRPDERAVVDEAVDALSKHTDLYQRGGQLVQIVRDNGPLAGLTRAPGAPRITEVLIPRLRELCSASARWMEIKTDADGNQQKIEIHPPKWAVEEVHARGEWKLRSLEGITESPVLRPDGTVLTTPGYDESTGLFYAPTGAVPEVPERPTLTDARVAVEMLRDALCDFPFGTAHHEAACVAALVTPFARYAFRGPSPLNLIDANVRAAGKSLLTDLINEIIAGRPMARMSPSQDDAEERKRITALVLSGTNLVLIDNVVGTLGTASLDAALTATEWRDRVLGASREVSLPISMTWYATGNNVVLVGDTSRRCLHIRLESPEERPEERNRFRHDPLLPWVREHRAELVAAILVILRAYCVAGRPNMGLTAWGSFEDWSRLVRHALVWSGLPDPGETRRELQAEADTAAAALPDLIAGWEQAAAKHGGACTVAQALALLEREDAQVPEKRAHQLLRSALDELVNTPPGQLPKAKQVGAVLRRYKGRVVADKSIVKSGERGEAGNIWRVQRVAAPRPSPARAAFDVSREDSLQAEQKDTSGETSGGAMEASVAEPTAIAADAAESLPAPVKLYLVRDSEGLRAAAQALTGVATVGLDFETTGLDPLLDRPRLMQLAVLDGSVFVLDLFATGGLGPVAEALRSAEITGHNLQFDLGFLQHHYGVAPRAAWCTMTASKLLGGGLDARTKGAQSLQTLAQKHLGIALPKDAQNSNWSGALTQEQLDYAARDALVVLRLRAVLEPLLAAAGLTEVAALEFKLIPAIVASTLAGVGVDVPAWTALVEQRREQGKSLHDAVQKILGIKNLNSQPQLLASLRAQGLDITSTGEEALSEHATVFLGHDPAALASALTAAATSGAGPVLPREQLGVVVAALLRARKLLSFANGSGSGVLEALASRCDGRVHAHFNPLAAPTGRFGCSEPNLLALEKSTEVRRCIVPPEGHVFVVADYAAIELRVLAHVTRDPLLLDTFAQGRDPHRETAKQLTGKALADITDDERTRAKAVNFGLAFGMGAKSFVDYARNNYGVEMTLAEAESIRANYLHGYTGVAHWQSRMRQRMPAEVRSASGRVRHFNDGREGYCKRLNMGVQGTAADGHKAAIVLLHERLPQYGWRLILSVHDENLAEGPKEHAEVVLSLVKATMIEGMSRFVPDVPIVVEADIRRTWAKEKAR